MICHQYKCIFVHVPKNGGQSVETVFLNLLGLNWETRAPLLLRENKVPELGPHRLAHLKITEYLKYKYISEEISQTYFKFSFVRNPWDRLVSFYKYLEFYHRISFKTFVRMACRQELWKFVPWYDWFVAPQSDFFCDENGNIAVDFVGRFEWFQEDFNSVCKEIGLPPMTLPHVNASKHTANSHFMHSTLLHPLKPIRHYWRHHRFHPYPLLKSYLEYYDGETRDMVAEFYRKDIEMFGYQIDNNEGVRPIYLTHLGSEQ